MRRTMADSSDSRRRILERRAAFVAAAIASMGAAGCQPQVCLSPVADEKTSKPAAPDAAPPPAVEAGPEPCLSEAPMPCLSPPPVIVDAGPPPKPMPDAGAKPHPCLKMPPPHDD
jgi:hypothetical protein